LYTDRQDDVHGKLFVRIQMTDANGNTNTDDYQLPILFCFKTPMSTIGKNGAPTDQTPTETPDGEETDETTDPFGFGDGGGDGGDGGWSPVGESLFGGDIPGFEAGLSLLAVIPIIIIKKRRKDEK
jgi:hypothetical protein